MANEAQRVLEILLKLKADTAGASQVRAEINALQQDQAKLMAQLAAPNASVAQSQQAQVTAQTLVNAQMERRVILETQLEAAEARIAGNPAMAAKLEREAAIRTQALTIQRTLNIETEEAIVLAERMVIAQEATAVASTSVGINMGKARAEAMVLGRELATGTVNMRTVSSLLGSLGTGLTIASIGAFELYEGFRSAQEAAEATSKAAQKLADDSRNAFGVFQGAADKARGFNDVANMAERVATDLSKMSLEMADFRSKELTNWQQFWDGVNRGVHIGSFGLIGGGSSDPSYAKALAEEKTRAQEDYNRAVQNTSTQLLQAIGAADKFQTALARPAEFLPIYQQKLAEAQEQFAKARQALSQEPGNEGLLKSLTDASAKLELTKGDVDKLTAAVKKTSDGTGDFNALLRESSAILQGIHQQEQLINQNSFLSADAKNAALSNLYLKEQALLLRQIAEVKAKIKQIEAIGGPHEQEDIAQLNQKLQGLEFTLVSLGQKAETTNFIGGMRKDLDDWVNSFGTSAHQIAGVIEGTINAALQGTNQLLLDAVFQTGDWRQTLMGVERQILNVFLTWIEQMAIQKAAEILGITTKAGVQTAANVATATSAAPAAVAQTGASSGSNWIIGAAAAAVAIGAIIAAMGGFARGGRTGSGPKIAKVGEEGEEFVFTHRATKNIGVDNLYAMMHAAEHAPHFGTGGRANYPGLFPGNDIEPRWLPGANLPDDFYGGDGPIVNLGGADSPIVRWPYPGRNSGGYIVESGITIYPGDDDVPVVPPIAAVDANGLPIVGGGLDEGPGLFPGEPTVVVYNGVPGAHGAPYWNVPSAGGYNTTPNYLGQFGGNFALGSNLLSSLILLGYGTNRYGSQPAAPGTINLGDSQALDAAGNPIALVLPGSSYDSGIDFTGPSAVSPTSFIPGPVRIDPGFLDPATGMSLATTGTVIGRDSQTGAPVVRSASGQTYVLAGNRAVPYGDINSRFGPGSGAFNADQFTKYYLAGGGDPGVPNLPQSDVVNLFRSGIWQMDPEGGISLVGSRSNVLRPTHALSTDPASIAAYNLWATSLPHGATGMRLPGPPSRTDTMLAWLASGEQVIDAFTTQKLDHAYGPDWPHRLANMSVSVPRFAAGGRVASQRSAAGGQVSGGSGRMKIVVVSDMNAAIAEKLREPEFQTTIINAVHGARHELGLPAAQ